MARANPPVANVGIGQLQFLVHDDLTPLPTGNQPVHRMLLDGPSTSGSFSSSDLLQIAVGGANAERVARHLLIAFGDLRSILQCSTPELASVAHGFGPKRAAQLKAAMELGRRSLTEPAESRPLIRTPRDAAQVVLPRISVLDQEEVWVLLVDARTRLMGIDRVYKGSVRSAVTRMAELFREAVRRNAPSIIVAHNHPTGDVIPSAEDVLMTKAMIKAAHVLDIELLDHLVCGNTLNSFTSMKECGLGFDEPSRRARDRKKEVSRDVKKCSG